MRCMDRPIQWWGSAVVGLVARVGQAKIKSVKASKRLKKKLGEERGVVGEREEGAEARRRRDATLWLCAGLQQSISIVTRVKHQQRHQLPRFWGGWVDRCGCGLDSINGPTAQRFHRHHSMHHHSTIPCIPTQETTTHHHPELTTYHPPPPTQSTGRGRRRRRRRRNGHINAAAAARRCLQPLPDTQQPSKQPPAPFS